MATRANRLTQFQKMPDMYSDFLASFVSHPANRDLGRIKNEQSIKQSLRNLIMTNLGERLFQPYIGSSVNKSLFDIADEITADNIKTAIEVTIYNNEPRIAIIQLNVMASTENKFTVDLHFAILNTNIIENLNLILRRVR